MVAEQEATNLIGEVQTEEDTQLKRRQICFLFQLIV